MATDSHSSASSGSGNLTTAQFAAKYSGKAMIAIGIGIVLIALGGATSEHGFTKQLGFSYLTGFMFFMSLCFGGLFLTIVHHLFDASWSVPVRRLNEHFACMAPIMGLLFIPVLVLAPQIYPWMQIADPASDHALHSKSPLLTPGGWYGISIFLFVLWTFLSYRLRGNSVAQDADGAAKHTFKNRFYAAWGVFAFGFSLTMGAILWMKSLEHQWFSTMYGVYYFAGSVWTTLATLYIITAALKKAGPLAKVVTDSTFKDIGTLYFAFTVFYAYIHFSQYFIIWNGGMPEETFYYVKREVGGWWAICMLIIFGHFFVPFLTLLRIDAKKSLTVMVPIAIWAWLMHYCDMQFCVQPILNTKGFKINFADIGSMLFIGGVFATFWLKSLAKYNAYPIKDPRLGEALGVHHHDADVAHGHGSPASKGGH